MSLHHPRHRLGLLQSKEEEEREREERRKKVCVHLSAGCNLNIPARYIAYYECV